MQRGERYAARERGDAIYMTGKPCANNHIAHRYTSSGACSECLNPIRPAGSFPLIRVRAYHDDRDVLASTAHIMALAHDPKIKLTHIDDGRVATHNAAGTGMYAFKCHPDDHTAFRELAVGLVAAHHIDIEKARRDAMLTVQGAFDIDTTPPINFN